MHDDFRTDVFLTTDQLIAALSAHFPRDWDDQYTRCFQRLCQSMLEYEDAHYPVMDQGLTLGDMRTFLLEPSSRGLVCAHVTTPSLRACWSVRDPICFGLRPEVGLSLALMLGRSMAAHRVVPTLVRQPGPWQPSGWRQQRTGGRA